MKNRATGVLAVLAALIVLPSCQPYREAVRLGKASKVVHDEVKKPVVDEIVELVKVSKERELTADEKSRLKEVNDFRTKYLDSYGETHQAYIAGLKVWRETKEKPLNLPNLGKKLREFIDQATDVKDTLGL